MNHDALMIYGSIFESVTMDPGQREDLLSMQ